MPAKGARELAAKINRLRKRIVDYTPALEEIAQRHKIRQEKHWLKVMDTPFEPASLRMYSEGRKGFPTPGTFATATGTLRDRVRGGVRVDKVKKTVVIDPMLQGNSHPTANTFQEVFETQEQIQAEKGAGSLIAPITAEDMGRHAAIVVKYIVGDWGK